jgi:hypothetical protein
MRTDGGAGVRARFGLSPFYVKFIDVQGVLDARRVRRDAG